MALDQLPEITSRDSIYVLTATDLETQQLHCKISPINGYPGIIKIYANIYTFYIGKWGCHQVIHTQCRMGSVSAGGSTLSTSFGISLFNPKLVIMIGIAFGLKNDKQKIGDVLVAESIIPYEPQRVGANENITRSVEIPSNRALVNRFKNTLTWKYPLGDERVAVVHFARMLSGEKLVDNYSFREALKKEFPDSDGGEMEGAGVASACIDKVPWILVKGICDFADGNKSTNKEANQKTAMGAALSLCSELLSSPYALSEFIKAAPSEHQLSHQRKNDRGKIDRVLFDIYSAESDAYYIDRNEDRVFTQTHNLYGIWLFGPTGSGKTNLIVRNLLKAKTNFIQINLSPCIDLDAYEIFIEIYIELCEKFEHSKPFVKPENFQACARSIIGLLEAFARDQCLTLFIEEIPVMSGTLRKQFIERLFSIVVMKSHSKGLRNINFVLSSINNPLDEIPEGGQKIHENIQFMQVNYWNNSDLSKLIGTILAELGIEMQATIRNELLERSKGSPRFIKKYFRNALTLCNMREADLIDLIRHVDLELNNAF